MNSGRRGASRPDPCRGTALGAANRRPPTSIPVAIPDEPRTPRTENEDRGLRVLVAVFDLGSAGRVDHGNVLQLDQTIDVVGVSGSGSHDGRRESVAELDLTRVDLLGLDPLRLQLRRARVVELVDLRCTKRLAADDLQYFRGRTV